MPFTLSLESIRYLDVHYPLADDAFETIRESYDNLFVPLLLNSALAAIRATPKSAANATVAVTNTTRAINAFKLKDADKAKAYYRRALARVQLKDEDKAEQDLIEASRLAPEDKAIAGELAKLKLAQKEKRDREKKAYKKLFS